MAMSAIILDTSSRLRNDVFWFLQPHRQREHSDGPLADRDGAPASPLLDYLFPCARQVCQHSDSCDVFIRSGFKTYWNIGMVLEMVRITFGSFGQLRQSPANVMEIFAAKIKYRFVFFLVAYATFYRVCIVGAMEQAMELMIIDITKNGKTTQILNCSISRSQHQANGRSNILAALFAGSAYLFYPNLTLLSHAMAATVKLLWLRYTVHTDRAVGFVNFVNRLPVAQLVYMMCIAYAFHMRVFDARSTAAFIRRTTHFTTGYRYDAIAERIQRLLYGSVIA